MNKQDLNHAEAMIKDYCDELVDEIKSLQEKNSELEDENNKLKQILEESGIDYDL